MVATDRDNTVGGAEHRWHAVAALGWEHERETADMLARAFATDPLVIAMCDAPAAERQRRMRWNFRVGVRRHCLSGQPAWTVVGARGRPIGAALVVHTWTRPTAASDIAFTLRSLAHVGPRTVLRGWQAARTIGAQLPHVPFTYLRTLGVDPEFHRRGVGSALVERVLATAPASLPVYLETANERNLSFYARQGFTGIGEFRCLGVPLWRLFHPPTV